MEWESRWGGKDGERQEEEREWGSIVMTGAQSNWMKRKDIYFWIQREREREDGEMKSDGWWWGWRKRGKRLLNRFVCQSNQSVMLENLVQGLSTILYQK